MMFRTAVKYNHFFFFINLKRLVSLTSDMFVADRKQMLLVRMSTYNLKFNIENRKSFVTRPCS